MATGCRATNQAGAPCGAEAYRDGWCRWHDPDPAAVAARREHSRKGGAARSNRARARKALPNGTLTMAEVRGLLGITLRGVLAGKVEPGVGTACANIARALNEVTKTAEVEERIADLERLAARRSS